METQTYRSSDNGKKINISGLKVTVARKAVVLIGEEVSISRKKVIMTNNNSGGGSSSA